MKNSKKELKEFVAKTLTDHLSGLKIGMSEKAYSKNIKKATRLLIADFKAPKVDKAAKPSPKSKKEKVVAIPEQAQSND